ncbi:MAG: SDR family oxidoreductase [Sphingomonadales bacterium]|nr:SDR family oxidoreductase [Sphingomonadales bacterium]
MAMFDLHDRTCLITGASSGLGAHFARLLAQAGARVVLGARRRERIETLAAAIGSRALAVELDVTSEASTTTAFDMAERAFGPIDTVIANAGVSSPCRATDLEESALRGLIDTNVTGVYLTAREGARRMIASGSRETGRGRILLIGSAGAEMAIDGEAAYCASKAAVATLGRRLACEWARQGICVNVIQPGFIRTEMAGDWFSSPGGEAQIAGFHRRRLQPIESLDAPVLWFCSDESFAATGAILTLDDGQSL